jgi:hypothetical protein
MINLPDLTPFNNSRDWWNTESNNAMLLLSYESNRFNEIYFQMELDRLIEKCIK